MRRMLTASRNTFSISIAVCNSPALRGYLVERLLEDDGDYVAVTMPRDTDDFLRFTRASLGSRTPSALFLVDLENSLPSDGPRPAIGLLNVTREKWRECFGCPIVFWLPDYAVTLLAVEARDFWAWRSHQFEFVAELSEPGATSIAMLAGGLAAALDLDSDRKRFRIAELQYRINAAGEEPVPDMTPHVATWLNELGVLLAVVGNLDEAEKMFRRILEIAEKLGLLEEMASQYGNLGNIFKMRGDLDEAEKMLRKSLAIDEKLGQHEGMSTAYGNLGLIYWTRGNLNEAEKLFRKSLGIEEKLRRLEGAARQYGNLGLVYQTRGDLDEAEKMFRKSLEINEKLGRVEGQASASSNLGNIFQARGNLDEAEKTHRTSLAIYEKLGRLDHAANEYGSLGIIFHVRGDLDEAETMLRKSLAIHEKLGQLEGVAKSNGNLGGIFWKRGDLGEARKFWTKARDLFALIGIPHEVERCQGWLDSLPDAE